MYLLLAFMVLGVVLLIGVAVALDGLMRRNLQCWLPAYVREMSRRGDPRPEEDVHLILCVADHFEPKGANRARGAGRELVQRWAARLSASSSAASGTATAARPGIRSSIPSMNTSRTSWTCWPSCAGHGFGEVEVHLHHEDDTAEDLRALLLDLETLAGDPAWPAACASPDRRGEVRLHPRQLGPG